MTDQTFSKNKDLKLRILDLSFKNKLSHIGSCITASGVIEEVFEIMKPNDLFVLDEGHAALALYVTLEKYKGKNAEELFHKHGVHPNKDLEAGILVSAGSLGLAGSIALGMAIADKSRDVYCVTSDGALAEGIWFEVLRVKADQKVDNLRIFCNCNRWGAYDSIETDTLIKRVQAFCPDVHFRRTNVDAYPFLEGQKGHYAVMTDEDYETTKTNR